MLREAVQDLTRALSLGPDDVTVAKELAEAKAAAAAAGVSLAGLDTSLEKPAGPSTAMAEQARMVAAQMRANPNMASEMTAAMENMTEEQMEAVSRQSGIKMSPEMLRSASAMMKGMSPEALSSMMEMSAKMGLGGMGGGAGGEGPGGMPELTPDMMSKLQESLKDPDMIKNMAEMMGNMSPEAMAQATGGKFSAEQMEQVQAQLKGLKPEHMAKLAAFAGYAMAAYARLKLARAWAARNSKLVSAVAVVGMGLLVRRWLARRGAAMPVPVMAPPAAVPTFGGFEEFVPEDF